LGRGKQVATRDSLHKQENKISQETGQKQSERNTRKFSRNTRLDNEVYEEKW